MRTLLCGLALVAGLTIAGCGPSDPEEEALRHLRLAARSYRFGLIAHPPERARFLRHLEEAARLSRRPDAQLALAIGHFDADRLAASLATSSGNVSPPPRGSAGEAEFAALVRQPGASAVAHFYLGLILRERGDPGAERHFRAAAVADRANALPLYLAAALRARAGDVRQAARLVREGNARPVCRLYLSPALVASGGSALGFWSPASQRVTGELREVARALAIPARTYRRRSSRPFLSLAARLLAAKKWAEASVVSEAVWQMGRKAASMEPLGVVHVLVGNAIGSLALRSLEAAYRATGDSRGLARVSARSRGVARSRNFLQTQLRTMSTPGAIYGALARAAGREWLFPGICLALAVVTASLAAVGWRKRPRVTVVLGVVAALWLLLAGAMTAGGRGAPPGWLRPGEEAVVRRALSTVP